MRCHCHSRAHRLFTNTNAKSLTQLFSTARQKASTPHLPLAPKAHKTKTRTTLLPCTGTTVHRPAGYPLLLPIQRPKHRKRANNSKSPLYAHHDNRTYFEALLNGPLKKKKSTRLMHLYLTPPPPPVKGYSRKAYYHSARKVAYRTKKILLQPVITYEKLLYRRIPPPPKKNTPTS